DSGGDGGGAVGAEPTVVDPFADRFQILRIAALFEKHGQNLLSELRTKVSPSLHGVLQALNPNASPPLSAVSNDLHAALRAWRSALIPLCHAGDQLQEHEEALRNN